MDLDDVYKNKHSLPFDSHAEITTNEKHKVRYVSRSSNEGEGGGGGRCTRKA
jgi:hypothetical protein